MKQSKMNVCIRAKIYLRYSGQMDFYFLSIEQLWFHFYLQDYADPCAHVGVRCDDLYTFVTHEIMTQTQHAICNTIT